MTWRNGTPKTPAQIDLSAVAHPLAKVHGFLLHGAHHDVSTAWMRPAHIRSHTHAHTHAPWTEQHQFRRNPNLHLEMGGSKVDSFPSNATKEGDRSTRCDDARSSRCLRREAVPRRLWWEQLLSVTLKHIGLAGW